jgi:hypothetical protein
MPHPKRERDRQGQQNRADTRQKCQMRRSSLDDGSQPGASPHEDPVEMLRGKAEIATELLLVGTV